MGSAPQQWEVRRLDLSTGQTLRMPRLVGNSPNFLTPDNRWFNFVENEGGLTELSLIRLDDFLEEPLPGNTGEWRAVPKLMNEHQLVEFDRDGALRTVDLQTGAEKPLPLPPTSTSSFAYPPDDSDLIVICQIGAAGPSDKLHLISLGEHLTHVAAWRNKHNLGQPQDGNHLYVFNADRDRLELRSLEDGEVRFWEDALVAARARSDSRPRCDFRRRADGVSGQSLRSLATGCGRIQRRSLVKRLLRAAETMGVLHLVR
jgi:hypothetical protein